MPLNKLLSEPINALTDAYRNAVDMRTRTYGESLLKSFTNRTQTPITESNFSEKELGALNDLIRSHHQQKLDYFTRPPKELLKNASELDAAARDQLNSAQTFQSSNPGMVEKLQARARLLTTQAQQLREAAQGKVPSDFSFDYQGYGGRVSQNNFAGDPAGWAHTLGRFRYKVDPATGQYQVYDSYDFNNEVHRFRADDFAKMSAPARLGNALLDTFVKNDQYALGEAYLSGKNAVPINIKGRIK
jgi:hypothetical protein